MDKNSAAAAGRLPKVVGARSLVEAAYATIRHDILDGSLAPDIAVDRQHRVIALDFERQQVRIFEKKKE